MATTRERPRARMNLEGIAELAKLGDYTLAFALRAVAAIGVADHLVEGPRDIASLASLTECERGALLRVLRALATRAVFTEEPAETFALGPVGELLRTDHPMSMRWFFRHEPDVHAMAGMEHSIRTGEPAFLHLFGKDYFDWLSEHDGPRVRFHESQRALNRLELLALLRAYPWNEAATIVDIGGNDGSLLAALLARNSTMRGMLFDLPETAAAAHTTFELSSLDDRVSIVSGNIFEGGVPHGADLYVIKRVLVGFSDERAVVALSRIREAMGARSKLLILEPMQQGNDPVAMSLDLRMLVLGLGRVRTSGEFAALAGRAGLRVTSTRGAGMVTLVECVAT